MSFYAVYVNLVHNEYNLLNINDDEIDVLLNAYKYAKREFFLSGKKISFNNLSEIRIYKIRNLDSFKSWLRLSYKNGEESRRQIVFGPEDLEDYGIDVTREFIKKDFGYGLQEEDEEDNDDLLVSKEEVLVSQPKSDELQMEVFISHSSADVAIAESLINIIRKALNLDSKKIRCTSVEGYKLPVGAPTEGQLRKEIVSAKVFIAVITANSISSTFVLFEIGARWNLGKPLLPLICDKKGTSLLDGPLKNINTLNATNPSDVLQFIENLGQYLDITPDFSSSYIAEVSNLNNLILGDSKTKEGHKNTITDEYDNSESIIKSQAATSWPDDYVMQLDEIERQRKAVETLKKGRPSDLTEEEFFKIRERAKQAWLSDYVMQLDEETRQISSLRKLKSM